MNSNSRKRRRIRRTYTKKMITAILVVALIDIQLPFILAFMGREQIAETMGGLIVTEVIGVFLVYCLKSFFETKESEKIKLERERLSLENIPDVDDIE